MIGTTCRAARNTAFTLMSMTCVPFLRRMLVQRLDDAHPGIVHEEIDPAKGFEGKPSEVDAPFVPALHRPGDNALAGGGQADAMPPVRARCQPL